MRNRLHISLYASSSARRAWVSDVVGNDAGRETARVISSLQALGQGAGEAVEILIADLVTPAEGAAFVQLLDRTPGPLGSVALIDAPGPGWLRAALDAGANAILSREPNSEELRLGLDAAQAGLVLLYPAAVHDLAGANPHLHDPAGELGELEELTRREREVLRLLSTGLGNKQIAARLAISEHTAKFHISSILGKLSVGSRTEAVSLGIKRGLIPI
jgi:DNA-binding NarL/FixJ family response regulator